VKFDDGQCQMQEQGYFDKQGYFDLTFVKILPGKGKYADTSGVMVVENPETERVLIGQVAEIDTLELKPQGVPLA
jgi:hypothetical protein